MRVTSLGLEIVFSSRTGLKPRPGTTAVINKVPNATGAGRWSGLVARLR